MSDKNNKKGVLVLAHGSKRKETERILDAVVERARAIAKIEDIDSAYLQFSERNLEVGLQALADKGCTHIAVVPYFLFDGVHIHQDIPAEIAEYQAKNPKLADIVITVGSVLGDDARLSQILADRMRQGTGSRFLLAATASGVGKTTLAIALNAAFSQIKGLKVAPFKTGPDFIDPLLHGAVAPRYAPSKNLDAWLMSSDTVRRLVNEAQQRADVCIIEGVMGLFDGLGTSNIGGSSHVAQITDTPVVLVIDGRGIALSAAAIVRGYRDFMPDVDVAGVIINGISSQKTYAMLKDVIEKYARVPVLGWLPYDERNSIADKSMGLMHPSEIEGLDEKIKNLGEKAAKHINLDALMSLYAKELSYEGAQEPPYIGKIKVAIAKDEAFCAYYEDGLQVWRQCGAEFLPFSPLRDEKLPEGAQAVLLCGSASAAYAGKLSENAQLRADIKLKIERGLSCWAEGLGAAYIGTALDGYAMCGALPHVSMSTKKLARFGYVDTPLGRMHEFRRMDARLEGANITASKPSDGTSWPCGIVTEKLHVTWPFMHALGVGCQSSVVDFLSFIN